MKNLFFSNLIFIIIICAIFSNQTYANSIDKYHGIILPIPKATEQKMLQYTWHSGCPVGLNDLVYLQINYWGFDNKPHTGELIVNKNIASDVVNIFRELYTIKFPIAKMQLLDVYQGDDVKSMEDNNTSAFNCRTKAGYPNVFSHHAYGLGIDINPLINPYIKNNIVLPPSGKEYLYRNPYIKGIITKNSSVYKIFMRHGWKWGGNWRGLKDYQHFEKVVIE